MEGTQKARRIATIIAWIAAIVVIVIYWYSPEQQVRRFVSQNSAALEEILQEESSGIPANVPEELGGVTYSYSRYWFGQHPIDEFRFDVASMNSAYYGCYYSPDDVPCAFQNTEAALEPDGEDCWRWQADGNHGMTRKLVDKWYYFEAAF